MASPKNALLSIRLDFRSRVPLTEQVQAQLRALIQDGTLQPGDQLPTVRQLAASLRISFNTIARAYRALEAEGLISVQHGRGTFVCAPALTRAENREAALRAAAHRFAQRAKALGFNAEESLAALQKAWHEDEPP